MALPEWQREYFFPRPRGRFALLLSPAPKPEKPSAAMAESIAEMHRRKSRDREADRAATEARVQRHAKFAAEEYARNTEARWRSMFGCTKLDITFCAMARLIGLTKNGAGEDSTLSNTSFISSGDISEPSA